MSVRTLLNSPALHVVVSLALIAMAFVLSVR
jgi:hypothetical protein